MAEELIGELLSHSSLIKRSHTGVTGHCCMQDRNC